MSDEEIRETPEEGLPEEEFSKLLNSISTVAPLMRGLMGGDGGKRSPACAGREALLLALKPYVSPTRCAAIDYLVRMGRIGDAIRTMR